MKIHKILNNNVIVMIDENNIEQVMMGRGIGFKKNVGEELDIAKVDKIFYLKDHHLHEHFKSLLQEVPFEIIEAAQEIIKNAKKVLNQKLNESLHVSLTDHIYHAIKRQDKGQHISNSLLWEIKRLYKKEYEIAIDALKLLEERLNIKLPKDEAGFIAMHIINAELNEDMNSTVNITKEITSILKIVQYQMGIKFDEDSINFYRFLTHLKFFVQRLLNGTMLTNEDQELYNLIKVKYAKAYTCAKKIAEYIYKEYYTDLTAEEMLYLVIHLNRLENRS
ncbi:BglG family transcription antiterminator LicT [Bacillus chungangensis]|uniref:Beta-glucoside operon transcriptional antiterminator n=1 Tax=Bacillus chungangensis TaxID=587633 RepID=A0ABT9WMP7_9BACI|nr:PRD domain-containing protein [Bacillus chungangensis]MDQ0174481.1 beta-glucoside operon transcriptional antiterminator [Bacillus chungangensis]